MNDNDDDCARDAQRENDRHNSETILMALDQISQTIDVMTSVVGRLRQHIEEQDFNNEAQARDAMRDGTTLH